jgi:uncharacterized membrane protein
VAGRPVDGAGGGGVALARAAGRARVAISLLIVITFLVPAILAGEPALAVALVASLAVMFVTLVLTTGLRPQTLAAALGIGSTLLLTAVIAQMAAGAVHLNGRNDELSSYLGTVGRGVSLQGIVLAGMVIGALGVLADTAVTQASAVMSRRHANRSWDLANCMRVVADRS